MTRACGFCGEGELRPTAEQMLRGGGRETTWTCGTCGQSVKLVSPLGRLVLGAVALCITAAVPWAAVTDRVARESERGWIVFLLACLALVMIFLYVRDTRRQRRHPWRASQSASAGSSNGARGVSS